MNDEPPVLPEAVAPATAFFRAALRGVRAKIIGGLLFVLPILVSLWLIHWLYTAIRTYAIDPLARFVVWKFAQGWANAPLPDWFEAYGAPAVAIVLVLVLLYLLGFLVHSRLHRWINWILSRVPMISGVYDGMQKVIQVLDKKEGQSRPQRVVLVPFPHPGMKVPAFVTGSTRDLATGKVILCVYVPTTPVPTSGFFLMVPEGDVVDLNWTTDQTLQSIISAGLTAPAEVAYYQPTTAAERR